MANANLEIDQFLARALAEKTCASWPETWRGGTAESAVVERSLYHGIAGLLIEYQPVDWPGHVVERLRDQALAQAMWEIRHKVVINQLLTELARGQRLRQSAQNNGLRLFARSKEDGGYKIKQR